MQTSTSTAVTLLAALTGFLTSLPLSAQSTITFDDGQPDYTDVRTTTVADPLTLTIADGSATQSGPIDGDGSVTKTGAGSIILTGVNTYTGDTIIDAGILAVDNDGGTTFGTLGSGTGTINGDSGSGWAGTLQFLTHSSAGGGAFTLTGSTINGGYGGGVEFHGTSTAGSVTFTANGATADGTSGGNVSFFGTSTAGSATLIANDSANAAAGGSIYFLEDSLGDTATVQVYGNGFLDIGYHNAGVTIGSLEGTGQVFLSSNNLTIGGNNASTTFSGTVQDGGFGSGGSLTKTGTGTLILSGTNTYTGGTTITDGTLQLGDSGTTGSVIGDITNDAALVFNRSDALTYVNIVSGSGSLTQAGTGTLTLSGDHTYTGGTTITDGTLQLGDGGTTGSVTGDITNDASLIFNRSDAFEYAGVISGTGSVTQSADSTLTLSGANTYTGATTVSAGTLALPDDNRLSASTTISITGGANLDLGGHAQTVAGLGSAGNGLAGTITAGTITTTGDAYLSSGTFSNTLAGEARLYIGGSSSTVNLNGTNDATTTDHDQVIIGGNTTGAAGLVKLGNANALAAATENVHLWAGVLNLNGQANVRANSLVIESGDTSALVNLAATTTASFAGGVTLVTGTAQIGGVGNIALSGPVSGAGGFTKTSSGTLTLSAANHTYTGDTEILAGALVISGTLGSGDYLGDIANSGALTFSAPSADQTLAGVISGTGSLTKSGTGTLTLSAANTYTGATTIAGGTLAVTGSLGAGAYSRAIANAGALVIASSANQSLSGVISGTGSLTKSDAGTLTLTTTNTYAGGTVLNGGILGLGADNALGGGLLTINGGNLRAVANERTLDNDITVNGDFTLGRLTNLAGAITLTSDVTLTSDNPDASSPTSSTLSGVISGAHSLTFAEGTNPIGTIVLTGDSSYTGGTLLSSGTLQIGDGDTHGSIVGNIVDHGSLVLNRSDATTYAGVISGTGSVTHAGSGPLTLTGANTYAGGTSVTGGGTLEFSSAGLGTGAIALDNGSLKWAAGSTADISSRLTLGSNFGSNSTILDTNGNDVAFASSLSGSATLTTSYYGYTYTVYTDLTKAGAGTLTLSGATNIQKIDLTGGTLVFTSGAYASDLFVGDQQQGNPLLAMPTAAILSGAGVTLASPYESYVGYSNEGSASLAISAGATATMTYFYVGYESNGASTLTVSDAGSALRSAGELVVGYGNAGRASLTVSDGATVTSSSTYVGVFGTGEASLTLTGAGSKFTNTGDLVLGYDGNGTLNLGSAAGDAATAAGILDAATVTGATGSGTAILQFNTTGTDLAPTYFTRDGTHTGTGVNTTGGLSLVNTAGTTVLSGTLAHTGATRVNGGTLRVNGSLASSAVTVASGATLGGSGTIGGLATFESGAHLAPGNSPGTLTFTDGLILSSGSILDFQLGTASDLIVVSGGLLSGPSSGLITLNLFDSGDFTAGTYTFIDATGATLTSIGATSFDLGTTIAGYTYTFGQNGSLFQLTAVATAIPEPATCALFAGVLTLALAGWRRHRRGNF